MSTDDKQLTISSAMAPAMDPALIGLELTKSALATALNASIEPLRRLRRRRHADAFEALAEELRLGNISVEEFTAEDGNVASMLRLLQCAEEGAARRNLRMMAQYIKNQHAAPRVRKDEFQRWAPILASLSDEEIAVLGTMHRCTSVERNANPMDSASYAKKAYDAARNELARRSRPFGTHDLFDATLSGLQRTGLILTVSAFGGVLFKTTTLLDRVATLVEWEKFADEAIAEAVGGAHE